MWFLRADLIAGSISKKALLLQAAALNFEVYFFFNLQPGSRFPHKLNSVPVDEEESLASCLLGSPARAPESCAAPPCVDMSHQLTLCHIGDGWQRTVSKVTRVRGKGLHTGPTGKAPKPSVPSTPLVTQVFWKLSCLLFLAHGLASTHTT